MSTFLRDADSRISEYQVRTLVADIRALAYDTEHVVESFIVKASSSARNRRKQAIKIKDIESKMSLLSDRIRDNNIKSTSESSNSSSEAPGKLKRFHSFKTIEPEIFVGFHGVVDRMVGHLVNERIRLCFQGLIFVDLTPLCCVMRTAKLVVQQWQNARSSEVLNSAVNLVMSSW
ncbi:hypothetical protein ACET3Z_012498 [Daucus carota]